MDGLAFITSPDSSLMAVPKFIVPFLCDLIEAIGLKQA
jgi:hypothetical protein